ncbi:MAG: protein involved in biosynthesis of mitomycin antibiotics/polyketide fumonisin [Planctomycetaceae bacterium]|nr:protein involved in biosynthesis of mitomycin antibiotics/polyketide fumonisin [Planctomycetaceae bacterium]
MYRDEINEFGWALLSGLIDPADLDSLRIAADLAVQNPQARSRRGSAYGLRNLLQLMPAARELASSAIILDRVRSILGPDAKPVKGILFDKTEQANWAVPWHQDITIAVRERRSIPGYDAWSDKDGVPHVQPPSKVMEQILAVRVHLDDCPAENGALKVIPGSHAQGRLADADVERWRTTVPAVTCVAQAGDTLFLRPLLLHSSAAATQPCRRRVLHFEYTAMKLPDGLEWSE